MDRHGPPRAAGPDTDSHRRHLEAVLAYLKDRATYKKIVVFIYDASASVQEHDTTIDALRDLEHMIDVVIVSRLSQLPAPGTEMTDITEIPAKRRRTSKTSR